MFTTFCRSPSKIKKIKPFKFPIKKEKHEKLKDKDAKEIQKEKKKDGEKEKKKDKSKNKLKDKKKQKGSDGKSVVDIGALYGNFALHLTNVHFDCTYFSFLCRKSTHFWRSVRDIV